MIISVIIPIFNEEENLSILNERLVNSLKQFNKYEIIYINDGSTDNSAQIIESLCQQNKSIKRIDLSRNFGHQTAVSAGLNYSKGDAVIILDGDLQDPPELIPNLVKKWQEGFDVVYAVRKKRKENILKRAAYYTFYRILNKLSDINIPLDSGDFCIMDKKIVNLLNSLPEKNCFIRGIRAWLGFNQTSYVYERETRNAGKPKYTLIKLIKLALDGIISFSNKPLQLASHLGIIITFISFIGILTVLYLKLFTKYPPPGYASFMIAILFMGGIQLFILGILGEYIGRIFDEVRNRPKFIVKNTQNLDSNEF